MPHTDLGNSDLHFWLTRSVAKAMGLKLSDAMAEHRLNSTEYADMVTACRACPQVETCIGWLGNQTSVSPCPPPGCCNSGCLLSLARQG